MKKFWTPEKQKELEGVGEKEFWTPERVQEYREAVNFTIGSLTGHIPYPEMLEKIRWRDVRVGDIIYYRHSHRSWDKKLIIKTERLSHRNLIEITWRYTNSFRQIERTVKFHGKKFTRLLARDSE